MHELKVPDVQAGFSEGRGTRYQISQYLLHHKKKQENSRKHIYFCFIDYMKTCDCVDHNKLWEILQEMGISDHLICLLKNLYADQEVAVRTGHVTKSWFKIGKGVNQECILSPCSLNLHSKYIMQNARLDESQGGIKIKISATSIMEMILH